tara:strand:+ start:11692 stop:11895 length:204 start_codon:yes stop_codon:yes gene_type:complete
MSETKVLEKLVKGLNPAQSKELLLDLMREQGTSLNKSIDIAIVLENQALINELHKCLKATIALNNIR